MKWIVERDALIAQTMAFVQSVTGKKDGFHPPEIQAASPAAAMEIVTVKTVTVETVAVETVAVESHVAEIAPPPAVAPPRAVIIPQPRTGGDFRSEMQGRIANFRKHQERFEREREEYCAATLNRLRAAIRDPSIRSPAEE